MYRFLILTIYLFCVKVFFFNPQKMSSVSRNTDNYKMAADTCETVFTHPDYKNLVSRPNDIIAQERRVIEDKLESPDRSDMGVEYFDFSTKIKDLEKNKNIYFTNENGDIVAYLKDQPRYVAEKLYEQIGKSICDEYIKDPSADFEDKMRELSFHIYKIELRTKDNFVIGIRLGLDHKPLDDVEGDKDEENFA